MEFKRTPHQPLTVIIVTRNNVEDLRRTIHSLQAQTFTNFDVIMVDDASTDRTWESLQRLDWPRLIRAHRLRTRQGEAVAYNLALNWIDSDFVVFHGAGDRSAPDRFEGQMSLLQKQDSLAAAVSAADWVDQAGRLVHHFDIPGRREQVVAGLREKDFLTLGAGMFRREMLVALGGFRAELRHEAGYDLWLRLVEDHKLKSQPKALYRVPFDPRLPGIGQYARCCDYAALARQLAAERIDHGSEQTDLAEAAAQIEARYAQLDLFARRARLARSYLERAEQFLEWGAPASDYARRLWWKALLAWPFSKDVWQQVS
jgi:glycosyltransferase involved in cell wall biosynthesis